MIRLVHGHGGHAHIVPLQDAGQIDQRGAVVVHDLGTPPVPQRLALPPAGVVEGGAAEQLFGEHIVDVVLAGGHAIRLFMVQGMEHAVSGFHGRILSGA